MSKVLGLKCVQCGREFDEYGIRYTCTHCGIDGILDVILDYDAVKREMTPGCLQNNTDYSMWRYLPAIPVKAPHGAERLHTGWTPLYETGRLHEETGLKSIYIKDDSRNPTASLKDRASAVAAAKAAELGQRVLCAASTGNAASSLAGFAANAGMAAYIFVPETAPEAKIVQLLIYGANVFLVKGSYDEAVELCFTASEEFGWYNRSCAINPYLVEGKKTVAYEICEQFGWKPPDVVAVAVGDGCTIAGIWKGFKECRELGLIDRTPRLIGIQAEKANPVTRAFQDGARRFEYRPPQTIADSISVGIPRNRIKALNAVAESGGCMLDVSDEEILRAMRLLAQGTGVFGEPAGVASFTGILKMNELGLLSGSERVVTIVSGSGLKDIKSAALAAGKAAVINPSVAEVRKALCAQAE